MHAKDTTPPSRAPTLTAAIMVLGPSSQQVGALVITLLAAGVLSAADYGTYALALVCTECVVMLTYTGFFHFIVTSDADEDAVLSTMFWVLMAIGAAGALAMALLADPLADLFDAPALAPVLRAFALIQPLASVVGWGSAALTRAGQMRRFFGIQIAMNLGGLVVGAVALILWQSILALVLYQAVRTVIGTGLFWMATPKRPGLRFDARLFRAAAHYAVGLYGARGLTFVSTFGTDVLLALIFSTTEAGLYRFANRLATAAVDLIAQPLRSLALRRFGEAARRATPLSPPLTEVFATTLLLTGAIGMIVAITGEALIQTLFQPDYLLALGALHALVLRAIARVGTALVEPVFSATGQTGLAFWNTAAVASAMIGVIFWAAPLGLTTLAWAQAALQLLSLPWALWMIGRFAPVDLRPALRKGGAAVLITLAYGAALWSGWQVLAGVATPLRLGLGLAGAGVLGAVAVWLSLRWRILSPGLFAG